MNAYEKMVKFESELAEQMSFFKQTMEHFQPIEMRDAAMSAYAEAAKARVELLKNMAEHERRGGDSCGRRCEDSCHREFGSFRGKEPIA